MERYPHIRDSVDRQDFAAALEEIEKMDHGSSLLLYLYQKGLVLHYSGDYEGSNAALERAEQVYEELYTKSISREAGALLTSDNLLQYRGERFESAMVHYYKLLNYRLLGNEEGALVECRKINLKLRTFRDSEDPVYPNDPFLQYLTGMVYFDAGELSDADVSLRNALDAYGALSDRYGVEIPSALLCDIADCAELIGDREEAARYREEARATCEPAPNPGHGALNVFLECGYISHKIEQNIVLPIYEDEIGDDPDADEIAHAVTGRYGQPIDDGRELDYLLRVALPAILPSPEPFEDAGVRVEIGGRTYSTRAEIVENLDAYAHEAFEARWGGILLKTATRGVAKYLAKEGADDKGFLAGLFVNIFNVVTESADTRSWAMLPHSIRMARLELPEGTYDLDVIVYGDLPDEDESYTIRGVEIRAGRATFANFRLN
jgi:tetratricopeptide (TPR) repeat protein